MNRKELYQWVRKESKTWAGVTRHFRENVVIFSGGVARSGSSQLRKIAGSVQGQADSVRRRLQRFVSQKKDMASFFAGWSGSVVRAIGGKSLVLVVDETKLKDRLGVMVVGMVYAGRCIPLAWRVYRANSSAEYPAEGQVQMILALLEQVGAGLPAGIHVRVLADRGIGTSPLLMRGIMTLGWTFLFRVTKQSKIVLPDGQAVCFYEQVDAPGESYAASGQVFKRRGHISAHVHVLWGQAAKAPWALVTNDPTLSGWEYAQRMWVEEAFRDLKSFGWQLEQACLDFPERVARLLIFLVVAYAWLIIWGCALELAHLTATLKKRPDGSSVRRWSLFREGRQAFLLACSSF